ncbi:MAG: efflux RND transporter periplasmic adaptor subunit [Pseudomonadota bacterium]
MSKVSSIEKPHTPGRPGLSGQGMDRIVEKRTDWRKRAGYAALALAAAAFAWWVFATLTGGRSLSVNAERIKVSPVSIGTFEDFIPLRGRLVPSSTVYLDAIEGGRVEQVLIEDGARVAAGDPIVILSNTNLQLEVLGREAAVTEQLNNMRTIELQLEQNRLSHARNLVEIEYQITRLTRSIERQQELASRELVSQSTIDELQDELNYFQARRAVTLESQATDARLQEAQLRQLRASGTQLESSLALARENLEDLNVSAPVAGKLTGFVVEVGVSIARGGRLGQIDDPDGYKLKVQIDEFYLGRVDIGQTATAQHNGQAHELAITKIYPQVNNGQFEVDMAFAGQPDDLRRGQTLQLRLTLGDNADAVLIPNGTFYQETGGAWVFVVAPNGGEAVRRSVRMGRRNTDFIEVLDGLEPGERVITSPYTSFSGMDRLVLDQN